MILKPNDILQKGDALHTESDKIFPLGAAWFGLEAKELLGCSRKYRIERPDSDTSRKFLLHEIAKLSRENLRLHNAYRILFEHNEACNARIEYLESMRKPCCKREEDDDWDEAEFTSVLHSPKDEECSQDARHYLSHGTEDNAGWLGNYEATYCTED